MTSIQLNKKKFKNNSTKLRKKDNYPIFIYKFDNIICDTIYKI